MQSAVRLVVVIAIAAIAAGCAGGGAATPGASSATASAAPSVPAASTPASTPQASATPPVTPVPATAPAPTPVRTAAPLASPTPVKGDIVAYVKTYPDVFVSPVLPDLVVYSDGSVITPGWRSGREDVSFMIRTLTPDGLARVRAAFDAAVKTNGEIATSRTIGAGFGTYVVGVERDGAMATAWTTNVATASSAKALVGFAEAWIAPQDRLSAEAWGHADPVALVPSAWTLSLEALPSGAMAGAADASILEPVLGRFDEFGAITSVEPLRRCSVVERSTYAELADILAAAGLENGKAVGGVRVTLNDGADAIELVLGPRLPQTGSSCTGPVSLTTMPTIGGALAAPTDVAGVKTAVACPGDPADAKPMCVQAKLSWTPAAGDPTAFRVYEVRPGAGAGATCRPGGMLMTTTAVGATSVTLGPLGPSTGDGERCLYVAAAVGDVESAYVRAPGDFQ